MCTVTFIPSKEFFFITSNRDEKSVRRQAITPADYFHGDATLTYPKDADAGGSWIAVNHNGNAAVLLNGAFKKHIPAPPYEKSRGLVFLDTIKNESPVRRFLQMDIENIESFTLIVFEKNNLYECRWDGTRKHCRQLEKSKPYIWSSATLYDEVIVKRREQWFAEWLNKNPCPSQQEIMEFHLFGGEGDRENGFRMNRNDQMFTVSITSIAIDNEKAIMQYVDLKDGKVYNNSTEFISSLQPA